MSVSNEASTHDDKRIASILIDPEALEALIDGPIPPVLFDVRWRLGGPPGQQEYEKGHLPDAWFLDLDRELAGPATPEDGRHPLPDPLVLESTLKRAGTFDDSTVVVYDDSGAMAAARAWWLLRWAGLLDVRVLNGGLGAWVASGRSLTTKPPTSPVGDVRVRPESLPVLDAASAALLARDGILLDARAGERYRGETEPVDPVAGHIPGALSAPTTDNIDASGQFLNAEDLRVRFEQLGVTDNSAVGVYCGSGVTAAHEALALAIAGFDSVLYPGSWSGWIGDPTRPVAVGPDPG